MKVNDLHSAVRGIDPRDPAKTGRSASERPAHPTLESSDGDSLDAALSARISARSVEALGGVPEDESVLTQTRRTEIDTRIQSGTYTQPGTLSEVAERMLTFYSR